MKILKLLPLAWLMFFSMQLKALAISNKLGDSFEDALKTPFEIVGGGVAEGSFKEFKDFSNSVIRPLMNDTLNKIDEVAANNILRTEEASIRLLDHGKDNILAIENQVVKDIDRILETVDERYRGAMRETFMEINHARAETLIDVRYTLGTVDQSLEARINQVSLEMMTLLAQANQIIQDSTKTLSKDLIEPAITRIEKLEKNIFQDLGKLVKELNCSRAGSLEDFRTTLKKIIGDARNTIPFPIFKRRTDCEKEMRKVYREGDDIYFYRVSECEINQTINKRGHELSVQQIADNYGQLELNSGRMVCLAEGVAPETVNLIKLDWAEYGMKTRFWTNFLSNNSKRE